MEGVRSIAVGLWFHQGSVHERPEERGVSHLLEHLVFKGTQRRCARDLALEIERLGGTMDAYTGHECTAYQARVPAGQLVVALDVLADLTFRPTLRERDLELERQVVLEELAGIEDVPEELAFDLHALELYGDHPYGARVSGSAETVANLGRDAVRDLHADAYRGRNAIVAAAGYLEHELLVEKVAALIPVDPGAGHRPPPPPPEPRAGYRRIERAGGRQVHLVAAAQTTSHSDPLRYALVLVDTALGAGMSSRLFQKIREERGLAYAIYSFASFYAAGGHGGAYLCTSPARADEARETLLEELREVAEAGLARSEIQTTREQLKGQVMLSLESPSARMNRLAAVGLYEEPYRTLDAIAERIDGIGESEVGEAASLLHPDRLTILELLPA